MRRVSLFSALLFVSVLSFCRSLAAETLFQNFDLVTPPALPSGWTSTSGSGAVAWVTTSSFAATSPHSVTVPAPASTSDTRLTTPSLSFPGSIGPVSSTLRFWHRVVITDVSSGGFAFDGGVLEISIAGGPYQDIVAAGGSFVSGGYTHTLNGGNPIGAGRRAWAGNVASFQEVKVALPPIPVGTSFRLRFRMGTDVVSGSAGWFIDTVELDPDVDVSFTLSPGASEVLGGSELGFTAAITNGSVVPIEQVGALIVTGPNPIRSISFDAGIASLFNPYGGIVQLSASLAPGESKAFSFRIGTDSSRRKSGSLTAVSPPEAAALPMLATPALFSPTTSMVGVQGKVVNGVDGIGDPSDLCEPVTNVAAVTGNLVVASFSPGCPIMARALNAQAAGAVGLILFDSSLSREPLNEPSNPALTIPVVLMSGLTFSSIYAELLMPFGPDTVYRLVVSPEIVNVQGVGLSGDGDDPQRRNNVKLAVVNQITDSDLDGVPDPYESCPLDPSKTAPGQCGCGIPDVDTNANGIAQCRANADLLERVSALNRSVKRLRGSNTSAEKALLRSIRRLVTEIRKVTGASSPGIALATASVNLKRLGTTMSKETLALTRRFSTRGKSSALRAISALRRGIAPA